MYNPEQKTIKLPCNIGDMLYILRRPFDDWCIEVKVISMVYTVETDTWKIKAEATRPTKFAWGDTYDVYHFNFSNNEFGGVMLKGHDYPQGSVFSIPNKKIYGKRRLFMEDI